MKYKVGDRVRIKSLDWYRKYANKNGIVVCGNYYFTQNLLKYCGKILMITNVIRDFYVCKDVNYQFSDEMIEELVEEETYEFLKTDKPNLPSLNNFMDMLNNEISLPEGYQFVDENGNVINATKIVLEKKEKEYPKSYEECCKVLGYSGNYNMILTTDVDNKLFNALYRLKVCRDVYWKIAGEEMGLGKPWEPDWSDCENIKYIIGGYGGEIGKGQSHNIHITLAFPTPEMRDAFYENFKELIEQCKELL